MTFTHSRRKRQNCPMLQRTPGQLASTLTPRLSRLPKREKSAPKLLFSKILPVTPSCSRFCPRQPQSDAANSLRTKILRFSSKKSGCVISRPKGFGQQLDRERGSDATAMFSRKNLAAKACSEPGRAAALWESPAFFDCAQGRLVPGPPRVRRTESAPADGTSFVIATHRAPPPPRILMRCKLIQVSSGPHRFIPKGIFLWQL